MRKIKSDNLARNFVSFLILTVWIVALYEKYKNNLEIPLSVEIGVSVVLSYIFGATTILSIIDYFRSRK